MCNVYSVLPVQAQSGLFPWVAEPSQPATMHNIGDVMSGGVQADPLPTQSQTVFEESVTMADIPRPMLPLSKFSSTPNHWEKTASGLCMFTWFRVHTCWLSPLAGVCLYVCSAA